MSIILILTAALLPAILLLLYTYRQDPQPEPRKLLIKATLQGVAICIPIALAEQLISRILFGPGGTPTTVLGTTMEAFFVAGLVEESGKLFVLWRLLRKNPYFDEHFDGIVYAVCVGLGFAAIENVFYLVASGAWVSTAISRALFSVPGHYAFAVLMGYYYSMYRFVDHSPRTRAYILLVPIVAHGIFDAIALSSEVAPPTLVVISLPVLIWFCIKMHKNARQKVLAQIQRDKMNQA